MEKSYFVVEKEFGDEIYLWQTRTKKRIIVPRDFWTNIGKSTIILDENADILFDCDFLVKDAKSEANEFYDLFQNKYIADLNDKMLVTLSPSFECNLSCDYCFQQIIKESDNYRNVRWNQQTSDRVCNFIEEYIVKNNLKLLALTAYGGEPMIEYSTILSIVKRLDLFCKNNNIIIRKQIVTNATLLDDHKIKELVSHEFLFTFSIDIADIIGSPHRVYHNGVGSFQHSNSIAKNCSMLTNIHVNIVCTNDLKDIDGEIVKTWAKGFNLPKVKFTISPQFDYADNAETLLIDKVIEFLHIQKALRDIGAIVHCYSDSICPCYVHNKFIIDPLGKLSKCGSKVGDERFVFCDDIATKNTIIEYENNKSVDELFKLAVKKCRDCPIFPACMGGCIAENIAIFGSKIPASCEREKRIDTLMRLQLATMGHYV